MLIADDAPQDIHPAVVRRIVIAQGLYACGAALCFLNTYYSIAAIVLGAGELRDCTAIPLGIVLAEISADAGGAPWMK